MTIILRDYQERAVRAVAANMHRQPILVAPTGSGKTVMGVAVAKRQKVRCLWVAHRREMIDQAADAIRAAGGTVDAGHDAMGAGGERFIVRSVQSLSPEKPLPRASLLVIDEAHHATAESYGHLVRRFRRVLGLTATPFRFDGTGLEDAGFGEIVVAAHVDDLCRLGHLAAPRVLGFPFDGLSDLRKRSGEFFQSDMQSAMDRDTLVGQVVRTWQENAGGARTVCFAVSLPHAEHLCAKFVAAGVSAEVVSGSTPKAERAAILARVRTGATRVVVNCQVLTEGWDLPALEVAIMARPTASLGLYLQMAGRIMRAMAGKGGCLVLDHAGNYNRFGSPLKRLEYSLSSRVRVQSERAEVADQAERVARNAIPGETTHTLIEMDPGSVVAVPYRTPIPRPPGTCRVCRAAINPKKAQRGSYCGPCFWKMCKANGWMQKTGTLTCPTCGVEFVAGRQRLYRASKGIPIYHAMRCNPRFINNQRAVPA